MTDVVWEDPPPKKRGGGAVNIWSPRLAPLREHPGKWANLGRHHVSTVTGLRHKYGPAGFEFTTRDIDDDRRGTLYARFEGPR